MYDSSLKYKWDNQNVLDYAVNEARGKGIEEGIERGLVKGLEVGREEGRKEMQLKLVKNLIKLGFTDEQAASGVEVSVDLVKKIRSELNR